MGWQTEELLNAWLGCEIFIFSKVSTGCEAHSFSCSVDINSFFYGSKVAGI
jgi:hypothetical protein